MTPPRSQGPPRRPLAFGAILALALTASDAATALAEAPLFAPPGETSGAMAKANSAPAKIATPASTIPLELPPPELPCVPTGILPMAAETCGPNSNPGFMRSLGRFGPPPTPMPGVGSAHPPAWDRSPTPPELDGGAVQAAPPAHAPCADEVPFTPVDFSPDPLHDCYCWDGAASLDPYADKRLNKTQRPWVEWFTPLYDAGPWPPSYDFLGPTNLVRPKFYVYGDLRTAVANNNNVGNAQTIWASRLNLDVDFSITATERFHMFWGPLDEGQQFTSVVFDDNRSDFDEHFDGWDQNTDSMFFEGDLGRIVGGVRGDEAASDLPFAAGLIPLVLQNGVWLEDAFVGVAATIPARNSAWADISNFDTTLFVGFDELTTDAFLDADEAKFVGATTFIERRGGFLELGWAYVDDPGDLGLSYHNIGVSYTRRYLNLLSNSARLIVNAGQEGPQDQRTADGFLVLLENSLLTPLPYNVVPYVNLFAGFDRPQPLGRLQGPLKNTGINFESDLLTGYPLLDDSGNDTYGGAFGVDLLGRQFDRQLIVEAAVLQAFGDNATRIAPGDQYALGLRYQQRLNHALILRADAMHGWLENSDDIDGVRVELRHKF